MCSEPTHCKKILSYNHNCHKKKSRRSSSNTTPSSTYPTMSLNYHELTMNEPRDSPARRKQHLVICTVMGVMFLHSGISAGLFHNMSIENGEFPGGEFTHKFLTRDYAAAVGTSRAIEDDLGIENVDAKGWEAPSDSADLMFSVFLDNDGSIPGGMTRFASGIITKDSEKKRKLLEKNSIVDEMDPKKDYPKNVKYDVVTLPKVDAAVAMHPTTGGVWSALLQQFKVSLFLLLLLPTIPCMLH